MSVSAAWSLVTASPLEKLGPAELYGVFRLENGLVLPYPLDDLFRGWTDCAGARGGHRALDIGGVGKDHGLGTPVRAIARSRVLAFATPASDPERCGAPLTTATARRGGADLPASREIPEYGRVHFFTAGYGRWRSGGYITLAVLDGPYKGYTYRYMHLAAVHPRLKVGDVVAPGEEVALLGGTGVQDSGPHIHMELDDPDGKPIELGALFGVGSTHVTCKWGNRVANPVRAEYTAAAIKLMRRLREEARRRVTEGEAVAKNDAAKTLSDGDDRAPPARPATCGTWSVKGDFDSGLRTAIALPAGEARLDGAWAFTLTRLDKGNWTPRIQVADARGTIWFSGTKGTRAAGRKAAFTSKKSGTKGGVAALDMKPKSDVPVAIWVEAWPAGTAAEMKKWLRDARWRLELSRPCRAARAPAAPDSPGSQDTPDSQDSADSPDSPDAVAPP